MKVLLFILMPFFGYSQMDFVVLGSGVAYQKFATNPEMDMVLHCWGGYFFTNASYHFVQKTDWSPAMKAVAPPVATILMMFAKELIDEEFSTRDILAGSAGVGASIIKLKFDL